MNYRSLRVGKLIKEELSKIILKEIEAPDALLTITEVEVSKKLDTAKVKVSVLPSEKSAEVFKILSKACRELQRILMKKINIKPMPKIKFEIDRGPENAAAVEKQLLRG